MPDIVRRLREGAHRGVWLRKDLARAADRIDALGRALRDQVNQCVGCGGAGFEPSGGACPRCGGARRVLEGE